MTWVRQRPRYVRKCRCGPYSDRVRCGCLTSGWGVGQLDRSVQPLSGQRTAFMQLSRGHRGKQQNSMPLDKQPLLCSSGSTEGGVRTREGKTRSSSRRTTLSLRACSHSPPSLPSKRTCSDLCSAVPTGSRTQMRRWRKGRWFPRSWRLPPEQWHRPRCGDPALQVERPYQ